MSNGAERVRLDFNPMNVEEIIRLKGDTAKLIDSLQSYTDLGGEAGRCAKKAQDAYELAVMWAVKAVTAKLIDDSNQPAE